MQKIYKVIIIGGGASGLFCAINLTKGENAFCGEDLLILERLNRVGKKLIATGNGQGNLSNANISLENYYGDKGFIKAFFENAKDIDLEDELKSLSIPLYTDELGRKYPLSRQANAVLDVFREYLQINNVNIKTDAFVNEVVKENGYYRVKSSAGEFMAKKVIFAFGGKAGAQFGTDGSSYKLLEKFNHSVTKTYPSLVQIKTEREKIKGLKGIKEDARLTLLDGDTVIKQCCGEVLFTDYGISGNAVFYISSAYYTAKNPMLKIEFLPSLTVEEAVTILKNKQRVIKNLNFENALLCVINKKLAYNICKNAESLTPNVLAKELKNFYLKPLGTLSFDNAQVTKGGIDTNQINPFTLRSKLEKDFYIIGEALNVDGDCGGYNLHFAFLSALTVANAIKNS